jgi:hypothetical protein
MLGAERAQGAGQAPRPDGQIVRAAIHPAPGVAQVGNSPYKYYFGPGIPGGLPIAPGGYKDSRGAMKRQTAQFTVYRTGLTPDAAGESHARPGIGAPSGRGENRTKSMRNDLVPGSEA